MEELRCPVCPSSELREVPFRYYFNDRWLNAIQCRQCGVIFLHPQPTTVELRDLYQKGYFDSGDFRCGHEGSYSNPSTLDRLTDTQFLDTLVRLKPGGKLLEIGCAGGAFLHAARQRGFSVQGVEFSEDAAVMAREQFDLPVTTGDVLEARLPENAFDVVLMGDVIEHLSRPLDTIREVYRVLRNGGVLVLALPTQTDTLFSRTGFFIYGLLGRKATVQIPPYHLFEYRPGSLRLMLERCGFDITAMKATMLLPSSIHLRGPFVQRLGKKIIQYPNWVLTGVFGLFGDRLQVFATKR